MRYRVRTPEGELDYASLGDLEQAYVQGLVEPHDEVLEEGGSLWRKAESLPVLVRARSSAPKPWARSQALTVSLGVLLSAVALVLLWRGAGLLPVLAIALIVGAVLMRVTLKAFRRPPPL
ncbi:hypothetical protein [Stigmatella aurantiaca]|uniref:Conserved uncharacterized protein n=1 Tax=Stigmatella aurantiaca (strain DW4/3-1) TaxID=378806 RepID=Q08SA0_STIAD|nr:hypothetical protein [Stigmatella aurantiaca]ADO73013.1 conserved uncharacterized protein [Stigmatella aurantiaca DW4/3-1]EAU63359.1 hypothetical protein STIAU_7310 [Stigmatella aurantiaca DW4/3-1]